ncbi:MAG: O-antigen ligase family protein, partial [Pontixanthobacter sp.]
AKRPMRNLPFLGVMVVYILTALLSVLMSDLWMSSSFYVFQLLRILLVFIAVASFAGHPVAMRWLAWGLACGAISQAFLTVNQKLSGAVQASGSMGHQNLLGLMLHFVTIPLLALLLAGERSKLIMAGAFSALTAVALGASRGSLLFVAIGITILVVLSLARRPTVQKWKIIGLGVLASLVIVPLTLGTLADRFGEDEIATSKDVERQAFERAAGAMWSDHPMGVGANQYVVTANGGGYSERAGVIWNYASRSAKVHHMYLLAGAETGWFGFFALIALFAWPVMRGLSFAFIRKNDPRGDIVLGASVAILTTALHGLYEWVWFTSYAQYTFAIALGIIAASIRVRATQPTRPVTAHSRRGRQGGISHAGQKGMPGYSQLRG